MLLEAMPVVRLWPYDIENKFVHFKKLSVDQCCDYGDSVGCGHNNRLHILFSRFPIDLYLIKSSVY